MHCPHPFSHLKYVHKCSWAKDAFSAKFWHASLSRNHHFKRNLKYINPGKKVIRRTNQTKLANNALVKWSKRSRSSTCYILIFVFFVPPSNLCTPKFRGRGANNMNPALSWGHKRKKSAISDLFCFAPPITPPITNWLYSVSAPPPVFLWPPVTNYILLYSALLCKKISRAPGGHNRFTHSKLGGTQNRSLYVDKQHVTV